MAIYYVSPVGSDTGPGTLASPMSLKKASGDTAWTPAPGDIFELRGGIYANTWEQKASGTVDKPLLYRPYSTEVAIIDGSRNAINQLLASPNPWTNVAGETGWTGPVSYTSSGGSESDVYSKSLTGIKSVWANQYAAGMGATKTAGNFTSFWDMSKGGLEGCNPNNEIHAYDATHDDFRSGSIHMHEFESQFDNARTAGTLYIRLYPSGDMDPANHQIYVSTRSRCFQGTNIKFVTIDGINDQIKFWRATTNVHFGNNSSNIKLLNCEIAFSGDEGMGVDTGSPSTAPHIEGCTIYGGGSIVSHKGDGIWLGTVVGTAVVKNNTVSFSSHTGIGSRKVSGTHVLEISENTVHDIGGTGIWCKGLGTGSFIKDNIVYMCGKLGSSRNVYGHALQHYGILTGSDTLGATISRNQVYNCGAGINVNFDVNREVRNLTVIHNSFVDIEAYALEFISGTSGPPATASSNIVVANNIFDDIGNDRVDFVDYPMQFRFFDRAGTLANIKFWSNQMLYDSKGAGGTIFWVRDHATANTQTLSLAGFDTNYPGTTQESAVNNNIETDPLFVDEPNYDLTLQAGSSCKDTGTNTYTDSEVTDSLPDIGAKEISGAGGPANLAPVIQSLGANPTTGAAPLAVSFSCTATDDQTTAANLQYDWNYGDSNSGASNTDTGTGAAASNQTHTYNHPGVYTAQVTVTDDDGSPLTDVKTIQITVTNSAAGIRQTAADAAGFTFTDGGGGANPNAGQTPAKVMDDLFLNSVPAGQVTTNAWARNDLTAAEKWFQIDFGSNKTVTRMATSFQKWNEGRSVEFKIEHNTTDSWPGTSITASYDSLTGVGNEFTELKFNSFVARYVRVSVISHTDQPTVDEAVVWEHRVWFDPGAGNTGPEILTVEVTDSKGRPESDEFGPGFLRDTLGAGSHNDKRWLQGPIQAGLTWVQWDFGSDKTVKTLQFDWYKAPKGTVYNYDIQRATDAAPTTMINVLTGQSNGTEITTEHVLGTAVTARYIRVVFNSATGTSCASCWEGRFFEEAT